MKNLKIGFLLMLAIICAYSFGLNCMQIRGCYGGGACVGGGDVTGCMMSCASGGSVTCVSQEAM